MQRSSESNYMFYVHEKKKSYIKSSDKKMGIWQFSQGGDKGKERNRGEKRSQ